MNPFMLEDSVSVSKKNRMLMLENGMGGLGIPSTVLHCYNHDFNFICLILHVIFITMSKEYEWVW